MNRSFDRLFRCNRRRSDRWTDRNATADSEVNPSMSAVMQKQLLRFRDRVHRSKTNAKLMGVFAGIAESMGWSVFFTRVCGCIVLLCIADMFAVKGFWGSILACGFFYLLLALLMGQGRRPEDTLAGDVGTMPGQPRPWVDPRPGAASAGPARGQRPPPMPSGGGGYGQRVDLAALDRQLDGLNRRIRRMEAIVTDRQYDWEQRLGQSGTGQ